MIAMSAKRRHVVFKKRLAAKMLEATRMGHTIAKQAGAINGESGLKLSVGCFDDVRPIDVAQAVNARAGLARYHPVIKSAQHISQKPPGS